MRLRAKDGTLTEVKAGSAVELLDATGRLAVAITQGTGGTVNILTPGDPLFNAYAAVTNQRHSNVHIHEPQPMKPVRL